MADLTLTREQANLIRDEIDDKVSLIETLVMLRGDGMELPTPCTWDEILRAVVAALDAGALRAGDIVRSSTYGICAVVDPTPKILCGDPAVHLPLSDLKRVEDR